MKNDVLQPFILSANDVSGTDNKIRKILSILRIHLGMDVAFISEFSDGMRVFRFVDSESTRSTIRPGDSDPLDETYCQKIANGMLARIVHDTAKNDVTHRLPVTDRLAIGSYMGVPITLSDGKVYGTFCCYKNLPDQSLNERDLSFLSAVAEISAGLIESDIAEKGRHRETIARIQAVIDTESIDIRYQPIYNLRNARISGFESLARFSSEPYRTPDVWFSEAARVGLGEHLEMMAVRHAVRNLETFEKHVYVAVNVSPEYVLNDALARALTQTDPSRIVLEITEHTPIKDYPEFRRALAPLRQSGMRLAVDDAGAGYASFQHVLELEADIIKLDISLTQSIDHEPRKFLLAKALCAFSKAVNCTVVAEGIETAEELKALEDLGADMVQGYLLGRPMPIGEAASYAYRGQGLN